MKNLLSLVLVTSFLLSSQTVLFCQTQYEANIIFRKNDKKTYQAPVLIIIENEKLLITGKNDKEIQTEIPFSTIKKADYSYTQRPLILEGISLATVYTLLGLGSFYNLHIVGAVTIGLLFAFSKKKRNWLVVTSGANSFLFELKKENYRQLLFDMNSKGINVEDSGNLKRKPVLN